MTLSYCYRSIPTANCFRRCAHAFMANSLFRKKNPKNGVTIKPVFVETLNILNIGLA